MTPDDTFHPRSRPGPTHPGDEDLSALIDGEGELAFAHVRDCGQCRARVEQLRSASRAVAAPVRSPAASVRDDAIARALAGARLAGSTTSRVVTLARWRRPLLAGGAAVAAAAAVVVFALLPQRDETSNLATRLEPAKQATTSTGGAGETAAVADNAVPGRAAPPVARQAAPEIAGGGGAAYTVGGLSAPWTGSDLGEVNDGAALRSRVGPSVQRRSASDEAQTFAAPADGQRSDGPTPAAAPAPAQGGTGASPTAAGEPPPPYSGPAPPCEGAARSLGRAADRLVFAATLRWQETPASVLAFVPEPPATGPTRVYVMADIDCRLLFSDAYEQ